MRTLVKHYFNPQEVGRISYSQMSHTATAMTSMGMCTILCEDREMDRYGPRCTKSYLSGLWHKPYVKKA